MNSQAHRYTQNVNEKSPQNDLKDIELCNVNYRDFKIAFLNKLNKRQENTDKQHNDLRNKRNEQKKYFAKKRLKFLERTKWKIWR